MTSRRKTVIVTGASQGIGAAVANLFIEREYNVVANSRRISTKNELRRSDNLVLVDGDIGQDATAAKLVETAVKRFGSVDALVNNAGIFISKPFTDYTAEDFHSLVATNLSGFFFTTQRFIRQLQDQGIAGSIVNVTASIADHPLHALPAAVSMITKGGLNAVTRNLAMEYAKRGIRVNAVAPGLVDTPLLDGVARDLLRSLSPVGELASSRDIAEAVLYLTEANQVTGEILHVNGGSHLGKW